MKKQVLFLYSDKVLEEMSIDDFNLESIEIVKKDVAHNHDVLIQDIVVRFEDDFTGQKSHYIDKWGRIMLSSPIKDREISGIRQVYAMETEEQRDWFYDNFGDNIDCLLFFNPS